MTKLNEFAMIPLLLSVCLLHASVCLPVRSQNRLGGLDAGTLKDVTYSNAYFGMKLTIPVGWQVQDTETAKELFQRGKDLAVGDDKNLDAIVTASEKQSLALLSVFKYQPGSPVQFNPGFVCIVERVSHLPGIKKGGDYLFHVRKGLSASKLQITFDKDIYDEVIGGATFGVLEAKMGFGNKLVSQKYYSTIRKGYALSFIIAFTSDEELKAQNEIIKSVRFD